MSTSRRIPAKCTPKRGLAMILSTNGGTRTWRRVPGMISMLNYRGIIITATATTATITAGVPGLTAENSDGGNSNSRITAVYTVVVTATTALWNPCCCCSSSSSISSSSRNSRNISSFQGQRLWRQCRKVRNLVNSSSANRRS